MAKTKTTAQIGQVTMTKVKDTKNFVAFAVAESEKDTAVVQNVYVKKDLAGDATSIVVTVEKA